MRTPTEARALERDDILEMMCQEHHKIRTLQGFTTAQWYDLEQRNRNQYRDAMGAALHRLETDLRERFIAYVDSGPEPRAVLTAAGFGVCADPDFAEVGQPVVTIERMPKTWRDMHNLIDLIVGLGAHVAHSAEAKKQIEEGRQNRG